MGPTLDYIKSCVEQLADKIQAPSYLLPAYGNSGEGEYIDVGENGVLSYVVSERGHEIRRDYALNLDHLLYLVFRDITYSMALKSAQRDLHPDTADVRIRFQKQLELLGKLSKEWQQREQEHQEHILKIDPPRDYKGQRQAYLRELMSNGFLYDEALAKAKEKYP